MSWREEIGSMHPFSEEAECAVIGSMMIEPNRVRRICTNNEITEDSFFMPANRHLFQIISEMVDSRTPVDLVTVMEHLKAVGRLEAVGGYTFLEKIVDATPTASHAEYYTALVKDREQRRCLIDLCLDTVEKCSIDSDNEFASIAGGLSTRVSKTFVTKVEEDVTGSIIKRHEDAYNGIITSIPFPHIRLTQRTGGVKKKMVTLFTGQSKAGKSMYKSFWMKFLGLAGIPVLDLCFEDKEEISKARCASIGKYSLAELDAGGRFISVLGRWEFQKIRPEILQLEKDSLAEIDSLPLYFDGKKCTPERMEEKIAYYTAEHGVQMVFVDGAKDIKRLANQHNDCGFEESVSQAMTEMANDYDIALMPIHHLTKMEAGELINVGDIRGSGNIVSDSRAVVALQSDGLDKYMNAPIINTDEDGYVTTRVLECLANNHGKCGRVTLESDLDKCNFREVR